MSSSSLSFLGFFSAPPLLTVSTYLRSFSFSSCWLSTAAHRPARRRCLSGPKASPNLQWAAQNARAVPGARLRFRLARRRGLSGCGGATAAGAVGLRNLGGASKPGKTWVGTCVVSSSANTKLAMSTDDMEGVTSSHPRRRCQQLFTGPLHYRVWEWRGVPVSPFQPGGSLMGTLPCSLDRTAIRPSGTTVSDGAVPTNHHISTPQVVVKAFLCGVCWCAGVLARARAVMQHNACAYRWHSRTEWPHSSTLSSWSPGPPVV